MSSAPLLSRSALCAPSCSGRAYSTCRPNALRPILPKAAGRRSAALVVQAMYNFTDSKEERVPGQRRNRGFQKKQGRTKPEKTGGMFCGVG